MVTHSEGREGPIGQHQYVPSSDPITRGCAVQGCGGAADNSIHHQLQPHRFQSSSFGGNYCDVKGCGNYFKDKIHRHPSDVLPQQTEPEPKVRRARVPLWVLEHMIVRDHPFSPEKCSGCEAAKVWSESGIESTVTRAPEILEQAADLFRERNALYGDTYLNFGKLMRILCPYGWNLLTVEDWNRAAIVMQLVTKLMRYLRDPAEPHRDSVHDMTVYSAMLEELDMILIKEKDNGSERGSQQAVHGATEEHSRNQAAASSGADSHRGGS